MQPLWPRLFLLSFWINKFRIKNQKFVRIVIFSVFFLTVSISYSQQFKLLSNIQEESHDFNPVFVGDNTLLFTRANHAQNIAGKTDPGDIWMIKKDLNGNWTEAKHRPDLSSKGYDLPLGMEDILTLLVLRMDNDVITIHQYSKFGQDWNYLRKVNFPELDNPKGKITGTISQDGRLIFLSGMKKGGFGNDDIYISQKTGILDWSDLLNLGPAINGSSDEGGPYFDLSASLLFFSSSSHQEATGKDILVAKKLGDKWDQWSSPVKWEQISTKGSETSITFISRDEVIWSSAQNSNGFEDLMTFRTSIPLNIPSEFQEFSISQLTQVNLKSNSPEPLEITPQIKIETTPSAVSETISPSKPEPTSAYRKGFRLPIKSNRTPRILKETTPSVKSKPTTNVKEETASLIKPEGTTPTKSKTTDQIISQASTVESSSSTTVPYHQVASEQVMTAEKEAQVSWLVMDAKLKIEIPYTIQWMKENIPYFLPNESKLSTLEMEGITKAKIFSKGYFPVLVPTEDLIRKGKTVVLMTKVENGNSIVLNDIQFKAGTAELDGENTLLFLNEMADFLIDQTSIVIRVNGHTDNLGDPALNKELSLQRAIAVRNYLIANGVNFEQLRISGWGGTKPIASNATQAGRLKNRRVEFTVENRLVK